MYINQEVVGLFPRSGGVGASCVGSQPPAYQPASYTPNKNWGAQRAQIRLQDVATTYPYTKENVPKKKAIQKNSVSQDVSTSLSLFEAPPFV